ncbi:MerR family transcriptional regulator [Desulfonatronum thioautotrophicum]|uniref:MerR family transcriptional regulator n=1 Tax=Desulfonatronum thioautotrophicum TaxID=617001 RepID=UPI000B1EE554|nr:MerR family transcriptional regulator [Desulfonatronum thioautotrophicum]
MPRMQRMFPEYSPGPRRLRIGEAAGILGLEPYVLRYWETEFPQLSPLRTEKGQRLYTQDDMAVLRRIQKLLHEEGLTIDGARRRLAERAQVHELTSGIIQELQDIRAILTSSTRPTPPRHP